MPKRTGNARQRHQDQGGRLFIPASRIRQIRWEESVARSAYRREGLPDGQIEHITCHCGSVDCLANPVPIELLSTSWSAKGRRLDLRDLGDLTHTIWRLEFVIQHDPDGEYFVRFGKGDAPPTLARVLPSKGNSRPRGGTRTLHVRTPNMVWNDLHGVWRLVVVSSADSTTELTVPWSMGVSRRRSGTR